MNSDLLYAVLGGLGQLGIKLEQELCVGKKILISLLTGGHMLWRVKWDLDEMFKGLSFKNGFIYKKDASFVDFLNRVRTEELKLYSKGLWDVCHLWLNLFWDDRMSAVASDEDADVFYTVGLLHSARNVEDAKTIDDQNKRILKLCDEFRINVNQYLPRYYKTKDEWMKHFGTKWSQFKEKNFVVIDPNS
ncbi:cytokinin dehydrogenase 3-like protein [Tanacetum coccineum]